jgi:RND family efflux transporter MFP subunit
MALEVGPGDRVERGQLLVRIDASAAESAVRVNQALTEASRAALAQLEKQRDRQRLLNRSDEAARSATLMAESQFAAAMAELDAYTQRDAQLRQYAALHQVKSPESGVVADTQLALGDQVEPGGLLLTLFDPASLRLQVAVPQLLNARATQAQGVRIELPARGPEQRWIKPTRIQVLPSSDGAAHTAIWQLDLPAYAGDARPGMKARVWLPQTSEPTPGARLFVPRSAVTQRLNQTLVYVIDGSGHATPRAVTVGPANDPQELEVLGGLAPTDTIAINPRAAEQRL